MNKNIERLKCFWTGLWRGFVDGFVFSMAGLFVVRCVDQAVPWYAKTVVMVLIGLLYLWCWAGREVRYGANHHLSKYGDFYVHGWYKTAGMAFGYCSGVVVAVCLAVPVLW